MKKIILIAAMASLPFCGFAQKFAHVYSQELIQLSPEAYQARETMEASEKDARETYMTMVDEFNAKFKTYQEKGSTWTQAVRETKEKELTDIQQRVQEFQQVIQNELAQQEQALYAPIYEKVNNTIVELAKKGGYIYVFDKSSILYIDEAQSTDLTPEARKMLNISDELTLEALQAELKAKQDSQAAQQ